MNRECQCSMRTKLAGDGCEVCNPDRFNAVREDGYASAKHPWVGLTDEDYRECAQAMDAEPLSEGWRELQKFARAVEAKLKEKNG